MSKIKAALVTLFVLGTSTAAMASPRGSISAHANASLSFAAPIRTMRPAPQPVVRDHRTDVRFVETRFAGRPTQVYESAPAIPLLSGTYQSNYGDVVLVQRGNHVTGTYVSHSGTIDGVIEGNRITFRWTQPDGVGLGTWFLDGTGHLDGGFGYGASANNGGAWDLTLIR